MALNLGRSGPPPSPQIEAGGAPRHGLPRSSNDRDPPVTAPEAFIYRLRTITHLTIRIHAAISRKHPRTRDTARTPLAPPSASSGRPGRPIGPSVRNAPRMSDSARPARSNRAGASGQARTLPGAPGQCDRRRLWLAPTQRRRKSPRHERRDAPPHRSTPAGSARPVIVQNV